MEHTDSRIDAYIDKSADFAKPILLHLRQLVHQAYPQIQETMKWSMPFFDHKGTVCYMAAFKKHCAFGFWKPRQLNDKYSVMHLDREPAAGNFGPIASLSDLPDDAVLIDYIHQMIDWNESGTKIKSPKAAKLVSVKPELTVTDDFIAMLDEHDVVKSNFDIFSPSKQKEYLEWFADAKTEATRQKRMQTALEWIAEGKSRHWKYQ